MPTIVPGFGPRDAKIAFVGEAPGREEEAQGQPFVGSSGHLLNRVLEKIGINRHECYCTNVVKVRPPNNDFSTFYLDGEKRRQPSPLLEHSVKELHNELLQLKPNIIVPLGAEALRAIVGWKPGGITKWRGSLLRSPFGKVCPTYHPAAILRSYEDMPIFELDIARVRQEQHTPTLTLPELNIRVNPGYEEVMDYLRSYRRYKRVSFDIETYLGSMVRCVGFSHDGVTGISIPLMSNPNQSPSIINFNPGPVLHSSQINSHWSEEQEYEILKAMDEMFRYDGIELIAQNAPFDTTVLGRDFGFTFPNLWMDTMLAHWVCYPELPKGLDFLVSIYTRIPYYSAYDPGVDRETWVYNCYDAIGTWLVAEAVEKELRDFSLTEYYHNHVHTSMLAFTRAQNRGCKIDEPERQRQKVILQAEIDKLRAEIQTRTGISDMNPKSSQQVQKYLYETLKLDVVRHHKTKRPTADKNAMEKLELKYGEQYPGLFPMFREYNSKTTVMSGFFNLTLPEGRIYTNYNNAGTVTGRLSSDSTFIHENDSTNLQNIQRPPALTRACFVPDDGYWLIKADLSQAEFRLVVWFAKIHRIIKQYTDNPNWDVHRWVASLIYRKAEELVVKTERDVAKNGVYGGNYKMHYTTAARTYKLAVALAKWVLDEYRKAIPEIPLWWESVQDELFRFRVLTNPLGMRRQFFGRPDDDMLRAALSHLPQSTVGGIINRTAAITDEIFDPSECPLILQVHDELVWLCKRAEDERYLRHYVPIIKTVMEYPLHFPDVEQPLIIPADIGVGLNWMPADKKKGINLHGVVEYHEFLKQRSLAA